MDTRAGAARQSGMQVITVKGQRLRVSIRPVDGVRMPLVLMNGLGAQLEVLQPLLDAFSPSFEVMCFDVPNIGGSPPPVIPYRPSSLAFLIAHMLERLEYKQVDVLCISWGGGLAQQFAFQHVSRGHTCCPAHSAGCPSESAWDGGDRHAIGTRAGATSNTTDA